MSVSLRSPQKEQLVSISDLNLLKNTLGRENLCNNLNEMSLTVLVIMYLEDRVPINLI